MKQLELPDISRGNAKWYHPLETIWQFLLRLNISYCNPAIPHLDVCQKEIKLYVHMKPVCEFYNGIISDL